MDRHKRGGVAPLGDAIRSFLKEQGLDAPLRDGRVFGAWSHAVGEGLARRAVPVRFKNGELTVEVDSSTLLHELSSFSGDRYRQSANTELDAPTIRRVKFKLKG